MTTGIPKEKIGECKILGRYPHLFSSPIFYVDYESNTIKNGTLTLINIDDHGLIGITCSHVIDEYLLGIEQGRRFSFQVGRLPINPQQLLIDHDKDLDLVTLRLNDRLLPWLRGRSFPEMGSQPVSKIYQGEVKKDDTIILGGLPGKFVEYKLQDTLIFTTFSIGRRQVNSASAIQYSCVVNDPNSWAVHEEIYSFPPPKDLLDPGGLSGGPVFIEVTAEGGLVHYELAGIIYEGRFPMGGTTLVLEIRPAKLIKPNGEIQRDFAAHCNLTQEEGATAIEGMLEETD